MSKEERNAFLVGKHCGSYSTSPYVAGSPTARAPDLRAALEDLADSNNDGQLDCSEFQAALFSFDASLLCSGRQ